MGLIGSFAGVTTSFFFPFYAYYYAFKDRKGHWLVARFMLVMSVVLSVIGFACSGVVLYTTVKKKIDGA